MMYNKYVRKMVNRLLKNKIDELYRYNNEYYNKVLNCDDRSKRELLLNELIRSDRELMEFNCFYNSWKVGNSVYSDIELLYIYG